LCFRVRVTFTSVGDVVGAVYAEAVVPAWWIITANGIMTDMTVFAIVSRIAGAIVVAQVRSGGAFGRKHAGRQYSAWIIS
jgi:hypothetical protein